MSRISRIIKIKIKIMKKVLVIIAVSALLTSCMSSRPYHACGITELNKQYNGCNR